MGGDGAGGAGAGGGVTARRGDVGRESGDAGGGPALPGQGAHAGRPRGLIPPPAAQGVPRGGAAHLLPGERRFAPDLLAVLEVEAHERDKWVVSHEGQGLDWVLEVHVGGDRKKDAEYNVERYARLASPSTSSTTGRGRSWRHTGCPGPRRDVPPSARGGALRSEVLGLELEVAEGKLRLWAGNALLLESGDLLARMQGMMEKVERRADEAERRLAEETRRREDAERRLAELEARLGQRQPH